MPGVHSLTKPIGVFDSGIGSYAAVAALRRALPRQDILYFADRASFPYGGKSRAQLLDIMGRTLRFLCGYDPAAILVASNAPSITVLDELQAKVAVPVFGVRPPIRAALRAAGTGNVAVLGVKSLVESPQMQSFAVAEAGDDSHRITLVDASPLVSLVESGAFLFDAPRVQSKVETFFSEMDGRHAGIAAITLSSTHLPWLRTSMEKAVSGRALLDPLDGVVVRITPLAVEGDGRTLALATEDERYEAADFQRMLDRLGADLPVHAIASLLS